MLVWIQLTVLYIYKCNTVAPRSFLTLFACSVRVTCVYYTEKLHAQWVYYTEKLHALWVYYTEKLHAQWVYYTEKLHAHWVYYTEKLHALWVYYTEVSYRNKEIKLANNSVKRKNKYMYIQFIFNNIYGLIGLVF